MFTKNQPQFFALLIILLTTLGTTDVRAISVVIGLDLGSTSLGNSSFTTDFYLNNNHIDDTRVNEILNGVGAALILDEGDTLKVEVSAIGVSGINLPGESTGFVNIFGLPIGSGASRLANRLTAAVNTTGIDAYALMDLVYDYGTAVRLGLVSDTLNGNQIIKNNVVIDPGLIGGLEQLSDQQEYIVDDSDPAFSTQMYVDLAAILSTASVDITYEVSVLPTAVPIPAATWLFGSGLLGLIGISRKKKAG